MVVVEGVARKLDPHLDMWGTAEPVVGSWIAENLGPRGPARGRQGGAGADGRLLIDARSARSLGAPHRGRRRSARPTAGGTAPAGIATPPRLWAIVGILLFLVYHFR